MYHILHFYIFFIKFLVTPFIVVLIIFFLQHFSPVNCISRNELKQIVSSDLRQLLGAEGEPTFIKYTNQ